MSNLNQSSNKDGLFNFIGTLGKKKKIKELEELEIEGKSAIDSTSLNPVIDTLPEDYILSMVFFLKTIFLNNISTIK